MRSPFPLNAFVRIAQDDTVTVVVNHSEMGQGPYTSMPMMVAEELDADWSKVRYEAAPVAPEYNHSVYPMQLTGGSTSTWSEYTGEPFACEAKDGKIVVTSHQTGKRHIERSYKAPAFGLALSFSISTATLE